MSSGINARVSGVSPFKIISRVRTRRGGHLTTNAYQERVLISFAKLVDSPLRRRLGDAKFEMLVIVASNLSWMKKNGLIDQNEILRSMQSAADIDACRKSLVGFFLEESVEENDEVSEFVADINAYAATISQNDTSKKRQRSE